MGDFTIIQDGIEGDPDEGARVIVSKIDRRKEAYEREKKLRAL